VVPEALPGAQEPVDLQERLEATVAALEHLGGLDRRIQAGSEGVLEELIAATEPAIEDTVWADGKLTLLRREVAALQQRWDELASSGFSVSTSGGTTPLDISQLPQPQDGVGAQPATSYNTHVGLDAAAREAIRRQSTPHGAGSQASDAKTGEEHEDTQAFEKGEYSADTLREGRLLARAERWSEAIELLTPHATQPEARYWIARCKEGLGQRAEAIDLYQALVKAGEPDAETGVEASAAARTLARRAGYDLRFLELKRELDGRNAKGKDK
jgi:hypothetical protein